MTPETVLLEAEIAFLIARRNGIDRGHLCYWEHRLQALQRNHTTDRHPIFFLFDNDLLTEGLSPQEWDTLKTKLWNFFKERI